MPIITINVTQAQADWFKEKQFKSRGAEIKQAMREKHQDFPPDDNQWGGVRESGDKPQENLSTTT